MTAVLIGNNLLHAPATVRLFEGANAPVLLTAQPLLRGREDLAAHLRAVPFELRVVAQWDRLPEGIERIVADAVLLDLDAANMSSDGIRSMSGHRLMKLMKRGLAQRPTAFIVITRLDFSEIEYLVRPSIHALVKPEISTKALVRQICAAVARMRLQQAGGVRRPTALHNSSPDDDAPRVARPEPEPRRIAPLVDERGVWGIPDHLWHAISPFLPAHEGNIRVSDRHILEALLQLEYSGGTWSSLPGAWGSPATIRRRARAWADAGVFERLRLAGLESGGELAHAPWEALHKRFATSRERVKILDATRPIRKLS